MHRKLLVLSITALCVLPGLAHDTQEAAISPASAAISNPAGMVVHVDPTTGAILEQPAPGAAKLQVPAELAERWSTSDEGLVQERHASGGVYMNLQGRFENGIVATITTDGKLSAPCAQGLNTAANTAASEK